jgi:transposase
MQVPTNTLWFGIDVSKATIDVALGPDGRKKPPHQKFPRTQEGCRACLSWVTDLVPRGSVPAFVMEATGGYSRELANWLIGERKDLRVAIAQPLKVHHFAKLRGLTNKTDRQDAILLALFGASEPLVLFHPMSPAYAQLRALIRERSALVKALVAMGNRNDLASESRLAQEIRERMLERHREAIHDLESAILEVIAGDPGLAEDFRLLQTIPGIGPVVAANIMGELGDLRDFQHPKALAAFVGVAPAWNNSGTSVYEAPRMTKHGNARVRQMLYLAALAAVRGPNTLNTSYGHLLREGKAPKSALGAVMRKILVLSRAVLLSGQDYDPNHKHSSPMEI